MDRLAGRLVWEAWDSPFGKVAIGCSEKGVRELGFGSLPKNGSPARPSGHGREGGARLAGRAIRELGEYASGRRRRFSVPLDLQGTPFQLRVWKALLEIPYGETRSYQQIARRIGQPRACRAVGMANRSNPVAILVPCHRVISSDGSLGGYAGGLKKKSQMLRLEKSFVVF